MKIVNHSKKYRVINSECKKRKRIDGDREEREEGVQADLDKTDSRKVSQQRACMGMHRDMRKDSASLVDHSHLASCTVCDRLP
jgi:hypothetical protein